MNSWITLSFPNIIVIQLFIEIIHSIDEFSFLFSFYFVNTMKYCYIGTETIIHCSNKDTSSSNYFLQPVGWLSLLSDTEKLFFLLLIVQTYAEEVLSHDTCLFILTCIVDLVSGHSPIDVIDKTESFSVRARVYY